MKNIKYLFCFILFSCSVTSQKYNMCVNKCRQQETYVEYFDNESCRCYENK